MPYSIISECRSSFEYHLVKLLCQIVTCDSFQCSSPTGLSSTDTSSWQRTVTTTSTSRLVWKKSMNTARRKRWSRSCRSIGGINWNTSKQVSAWWRHQTFSALLALCAGNSPVTGEFPTQRPVTWSFDVFFHLRICVWINGWVNNREAGDLRRYRAHYDVIVMGTANLSQVERPRKIRVNGPLWYDFIYVVMI